MRERKSGEIESKQRHTLGRRKNERDRERE